MAKRRKPVQARALEKYNRILNAAPKVLIEYGYEKATTEHIALEADVAIGTLYEYFKNKEDIYSLYLGNQMKVIMASVAEEFADHLAIEPDKILSNLLDLGVHFIYSNHEIFSAIVREIPAVWKSEALKKLESRLLSLAMVLFEQQKGQVKITSEEYTVVIKMMINCVVGSYIRLALIGTDDFNEDEFKQELKIVLSSYVLEKTGLHLIN